MLHAPDERDRSGCCHDLAVLWTADGARVPAQAACMAAVATWDPRLGWPMAMRTASRYLRARHLAATGDPAEALVELEPAISEDAAYRARARDEPDLAALHDDPALARVVA